MRTLLLCAVLLCCPGCCRAGGGSARAVIEDFYKAYLSRPAGPAKPMDLPFSRSFLELKKNNSAACAAYAGTDICGWGADGDIYLDTQEYDPGLNYKNSGFKAVEAKPGVIDVAFNVYPGEKKQPAYYDKKLRYLLVKEGGAWVVDDLLAAGRSARAAMLDEIAFYTKQGG
ncbi:MAG TPA: hypothetical protein PKI19_14815, partial [Elusimicrobiales bacterium]|nr:hypothetical protein [Elusimicrobiales bacterium]